MTHPIPCPRLDAHPADYDVRVVIGEGAYLHLFRDDDGTLHWIARPHTTADEALAALCPVCEGADAICSGCQAPWHPPAGQDGCVCQRGHDEEAA